MVRMETISFLISDFKGTADIEINKSSYSRRLEVSGEYDIDITINDFIQDKDVIDIKINSETIHRHNNGGCDTILRTYTIIYKV